MVDLFDIFNFLSGNVKDMHESDFSTVHFLVCTKYMFVLQQKFLKSSTDQGSLLISDYQLYSICRP